MPQLGTALLKSVYNVPDALVATQASTKLGIGTLQTQGDGGFYDPNDVALFWKRNNLTGTPNTTWVRACMPSEEKARSSSDARVGSFVCF